MPSNDEQHAVFCHAYGASAWSCRPIALCTVLARFPGQTCEHELPHVTGGSCTGTDADHDEQVLPPDWQHEEDLEPADVQRDLNAAEQHTGPEAHVPTHPVHEPQDDILANRMRRMLENSRPDLEALDVDEQRGWAEARYKNVVYNDPDSQIVWQYAFDHMKIFRTNVQSKSAANSILEHNARRQFPKLGKPDPAGFRNCYPPSIAACEAILGVPNLSRYLIHVCPTGCEHWWTFMPKASEHFKDCHGCPECRCPHCGAARFVHHKKRGVTGQSMCWLFCDAFQTMMLEPDIAEAVLKGQAARNDQTVPNTHPHKPSLAKYKEGGRLQEELPKSGYDMDKVRFYLNQL